MGSLVAILPLSIVMIAGPQIISSFFLATSEHWRANSAAYVAGAAVSISGFVSLSYLVADSLGGSIGEKHHGGGAHAADYVILALLIALIVVVFLRRDQSEPPTWMGKLQTARPRFAAGLGLGLLGVFPTDIMTTVTVGIYLAHHGDPLLHALPFVALTLFLLASPAIVVTLFGARAERILPKLRNWMSDHSWIVSEAVLLLFVAIEIAGMLS